MMEIQVTIKASDLSEAINNLAAALSGTDRCTAIKEAPKSETYDLNKLPQNMPHVAPVVQPAATPVVQAPVAPVAPAPVAQTATPAAVTAPAQREYKLDDLAVAMAALIDEGKMAQCMEAIKKYGVQAINQLGQDKYAAFAEDLKALGAKF